MQILALQETGARLVAPPGFRLHHHLDAKLALLYPAAWRFETRIERARFLLITFSSPSICIVNLHLPPSDCKAAKKAVVELCELAATSGAASRLILGDFNQNVVNPRVVSLTCELAAVHECINELPTCITRRSNGTDKESVLDFILFSSPPSFPAVVHDVRLECDWALSARGGHIHHLLLDTISVESAAAPRPAPLASRFSAASSADRKRFSRNVSARLSAIEPAGTATAVEQQLLSAIAAEAPCLPELGTSARTGAVLRNHTPEQTVAAAHAYYSQLYERVDLPDGKLPPLSATRAAKVRADALAAPVTEDEVMAALKTKKRRMAGDHQCGVNTIVLRFLAHHSCFRRFLTRFVELSLQTQLTDSASTAGSILIPKQLDTVPADVLEARPIAVGPALAKVPKTVLARRLQTAICGAVAPNQHGFIKGRSASTCAQRVISLLGESKDRVAVFADVSKAYDTVAHATILASIRRFGLGDHFYHLVRSYLAAIRTRFHAGGASSDWIRLHRGVLQGCPLSCLLFILATDHVFTSASTSDDFGFADDIASVGRLTHVTSTVDRILPVLEAAGLSVNVSKFGFLGSDDRKSIRVGQTTVFDRGKPVNYLGYPLARNASETRDLLFARALSYCRMAVPKLYAGRYMQAVAYINQQLAPRIAYIARIATFTQFQLDQLDAPVVRVLQRHPGKCHAGTMSKGALFAVLRVQLPSMVAMRSRVYFLNSHPPVKCKYLTRMNISLPLTRSALKTAMNAFFHECYTVKWMESRSGEMVPPSSASFVVSPISASPLHWPFSLTLFQRRILCTSSTCTIVPNVRVAVAHAPRATFLNGTPRCH